MTLRQGHHVDIGPRPAKNTATTACFLVFILILIVCTLSNAPMNTRTTKNEINVADTWLKSRLSRMLPDKNPSESTTVLVSPDRTVKSLQQLRDTTEKQPDAINQRMGLSPILHPTSFSETNLSAQLRHRSYRSVSEDNPVTRRRDRMEPLSGCLHSAKHLDHCKSVLLWNGQFQHFCFINDACVLPKTSFIYWEMNWDPNDAYTRTSNSSTDTSALTPFARTPMLTPGSSDAARQQLFEPQALPFAGFVVRIPKDDIPTPTAIHKKDPQRSSAESGFPEKHANVSSNVTTSEIGMNPIGDKVGMRLAVYVDIRQAGYTYTHTRAFPLKNWYYESSVPFRKTSSTKIIHISGTLVNLVVAFSEFYQHDVFDLLPRVRLVLEALLMDSQDFPTVTSALRNTSMSASSRVTYLVIGTPSAILLEGLGIPPENVVIAEPLSDCIYTADEVLLPNFAPANGVKYNPLRMGIHPEGYLSTIQRVYAEALWPERRTIVLYLQRPNHKVRGMDVDNERELLQKVNASLASGYTLEIFNSSGDWRKDRYVFANAAAVFGPHGGAEANILFCHPGTPVIEFNPMYDLQRSGVHNVRPCYLGLAQMCNLPYWIVQPIKGFHFEKLPGIVVDPEHVLGILRHVGIAN
eukprot:m.856507 g.856507  ORF g.856507 m.856507 type:complete len:636 (-) comp23513_c1_seq2:1615-3522(-)